MTTELRKISVGDFIFRVLSGVAIGIVVGLVPNAILGEIFKALMHHHPIFATLLHVVRITIYCTSISRCVNCD